MTPDGFSVCAAVLLQRADGDVVHARQTAPDEIGEALGDGAGREEGAAFVGVDVVVQGGDDVGHGPHRDRVRLDLLQESVRLVNSPTRTAKSALDDARNFAASSGRGSLTNFTCGVLLHSRTARYASGPSGASRMPSGAYVPPTCSGSSDRWREHGWVALVAR